VAIYRFTLMCIDQRDGLCLHSLHGGIFWVLSGVWSGVVQIWVFLSR